MGRRIVVTPMETAGEPRFDSWLPGEGLLEESLALAAIVFVLGEIVVLGVSYLFMSLADAAVTTVSAAPIVAALAAMLALFLAFYRVLRFERRERRYMQFLDYQLDALMAEEDDEPVEAAPNVRDTKYWDRLAFTLMRRYYDTLNRTRSREAAARAISRDACVKAGLCNQKEWNVVNRLFVARGLRRGRKRGLTPRTFDEAWRLWQAKSAEVSGWYVDEHGDWIPKE